MNWTKVKLPFRLGEHHQLNDGLLGYWMESNQGNFDSKFIAPETPGKDVNDPAIDPYSSKNFQTQWLALDDEPVNITMLTDPRGPVHATTGLLPTKAISIPPQYYLPALRKIGMWFKTFPLLQPAQQSNNPVLLNLPEIEDYNWQWWDKFQGVRPVDKDDNTKHIHSASQIIDGWLSLIPADKHK